MSTYAALDQQIKAAIKAGKHPLYAAPVCADARRIRNGARWECFDGQCKGCGQDIAPGRVTGRLTRLVESVATVEAVGVCDPCKLVTRFHYRLHDDMRITGMTDDG
ncbi:hypothetical protein [Paucibacter soli]|uniref:hypothetical protein n=1 Tax=Paucibacter soli TaxID=3133433 RepID=UPI0030A057D6